jgi:hypothetical protein
VQGYVRPLEDSSCADREVKLTFVAAVEASLTKRNAILTGTGWTGNAFRPETALKVNTGRLFVGEHLKQFESADG